MTGHGDPQHAFDQAYWERRYRESRDRERPVEGPGTPNPHLVREVAALTPGTALDAGCGEGAEALWLAGQGWRATAVDIAPDVLERTGAPLRPGHHALRARGGHSRRA